MTDIELSVVVYVGVVRKPPKQQGVGRDEGIVCYSCLGFGVNLLGPSDPPHLIRL